MSQYYKDYIWKNGIPYGISKQENPIGFTCKIPMDPYRKRIAIELYQNDQFVKNIYDSALLDFRHLKPNDQTAWQKTLIYSNPEKAVSHLRNQDDRLICIETCYFKDNRCVNCQLTTPHGIPLSIHRLFYTANHDPFNGVILFDTNEHPVMIKKYSLNEDMEFNEILEEQWEMHPVILSQLQTPRMC